MDMHVTDLVNEMLAKYVDAKGASLVKSVAHQHAVAHNCEGFEVDEARSSAELMKLFDEAAMAKLSEDDQQNMRTTVLMGFAAMLGGHYAIAAADHDAFCAHAAEEYAGTEGSKDHIILVKK
jgi:hypothetical protein